MARNVIISCAVTGSNHTPSMSPHLPLTARHGTRFEFKCYHVGHLYTLKHFVDRGLVKGTLFLQFALGILGASAPTRRT